MEEVLQQVTTQLSAVAENLRETRAGAERLHEEFMVFRTEQTVINQRVTETLARLTTAGPSKQPTPKRPSLVFDGKIISGSELESVLSIWKLYFEGCGIVQNGAVLVREFILHALVGSPQMYVLDGMHAGRICDWNTLESGLKKRYGGFNADEVVRGRLRKLCVLGEGSKLSVLDYTNQYSALVSKLKTRSVDDLVSDYVSGLPVSVRSTILALPGLETWEEAADVACRIAQTGVSYATVAGASGSGLAAMEAAVGVDLRGKQDDSSEEGEDDDGWTVANMGKAAAVNRKRSWMKGGGSSNRGGFGKGKKFDAGGGRNALYARAGSKPQPLFPGYDGCFNCGGVDHRAFECPGRSKGRGE